MRCCSLPRRRSRQSELSSAAYAEVVRICQAVGASRAGIELAAAWVHVGCQEDKAEIRRNLDFLRRQRCAAAQRSLRAAFEPPGGCWTTSTAILPALAVFAGGFMRQAAEAVAGASLLTLASLMAKSLVELSTRALRPARDRAPVRRRKLAAGDHCTTARTALALLPPSGAAGG